LLYEVFVNTSGEADSYFPGRWDGTALWDFYARMQRLADQSAAHVLGTYPLADEGKLRYHPAATLHWYEPAWYGRITDDQEVMNILEHLSSRAAALGYDRLIAVVPTGWLRSHGQDGAIGITWDSARRSSIVEIQNVDGAPWVVTHEMLHNLGYDDIYSGGVCRVRADNGYWVNETRAIDGSRTYDYMDYAGCSSPQWTTAQRLAYVRDRLPASDDPPVLLFRAILSKSGEVELRPFQLVQGIPDVSVKGGNYAVTVLDGAGRVLAQTRLEVKFQK
ncbi:MAG: hypothetical protein NUV35_08340, partial [Syntrophomonadaceae bacterium]|nr:hypothetical protein [Syntrophomonadaceae bacterium]